jgi:hypothetical protein
MYQRKQQGSLYSKAFMAFVIGAAVLVGLKAFPIYMNELKVQSAMSGVAGAPEAQGNVSIGTLRQMLQRRWDVDDVKHLKVGDIKFVKTKAGRVMRYEYEVRTDLFANWALVIRFEDEQALGGAS